MVPLPPYSKVPESKLLLTEFWSMNAELIEKVVISILLQYHDIETEDS